MGSIKDLFIAHDILGAGDALFHRVIQGPKLLSPFLPSFQASGSCSGSSAPLVDEEREGEEDFKGPFREPGLKEARSASTHMPLTGLVTQGHLDIK